MKNISRRKFGKLIGGAAIAAPAAAIAQQQRPKQPPPPPPPPPAAAAAPPTPAPAVARENRLKLTADQEARVKQAVERRERQAAVIREYPLETADEPAFVFRVKTGGNRKA